MSVEHTLHLGRSCIPSHQRRAAKVSLSHGYILQDHMHELVMHSSGCPTTGTRSWPQRSVYLQPAAIQSLPLRCHSIILKRWCRKPWPNRRRPQQCEAASQLSQLCRRHPTLLSSLTAASCWCEGPSWGTHMCRWTAAQTPRYHRKSTHLSYSLFALWRRCNTLSFLKLGFHGVPQSADNIQSNHFGQA